jgi:hypothetical protein
MRRKIVSASIALLLLLALPGLASAGGRWHGQGYGRGHGYGYGYGHRHGWYGGGTRVFVGVGPALWWGAAPYGYWRAPYPVYPYGYGYGYGYAPYYPPVYAPRVVDQESPAYVQREAPEEEGSWYYCASERGYYPDVPTCPEEWIPVPPRRGYE